MLVPVTYVDILGAGPFWQRFTGEVTVGGAGAGIIFTVTVPEVRLPQASVIVTVYVVVTVGVTTTLCPGRPPGFHTKLYGSAP